ncbi:MAG: type 4a pilus biogenesis protein PilO, partial [Kangiellaceae bacterium]|nr:type 4a pilus biogenesis protein PilO [Kangiellaceae bacterium]
SIIGGYHQLAEFVSRVSNMPRIVTLHDFTIEMTNKNLFGSDIEKQLEMKVLAKTYRYDEDGGVE